MDGLPFIVPGALAAAIVGTAWGWGWASPFLLFTAFSIWFFRDPEREIPQGEGVVVSPADGTVLGVTEVKYPRLLTGDALRVSIFMSPLNVHVNRAPVSGIVRETDYHPGKYFAAYAEKASLDNEQSAVVVQTDRGLSVMFVQIAGFIARRIVTRLEKGERVNRGERYGLIRFGSRADVYLPKGSRASVKTGDRVRAGSTIVGVLP